MGLSSNKKARDMQQRNLHQQSTHTTTRTYRSCKSVCSVPQKFQCNPPPAHPNETQSPNLPPFSTNAAAQNMQGRRGLATTLGLGLGLVWGGDYTSPLLCCMHGAIGHMHCICMLLGLLPGWGMHDCMIWGIFQGPHMRGVHNSDGTSVPSDTSKYLRCIQAVVQGPFVWSRASQVGARWRFVSSPPLFPFPTLRNPPSASGQAFGDETDLGCFFLLGGERERRGGFLHVWGFPGTYFRYLGTGDRGGTTLAFYLLTEKPKKKGSCADRSGDLISSTLLFPP